MDQPKPSDPQVLFVWSSGGPTAPAASPPEDAAAASAQWGMASLVVNGVLLLAFPLALVALLMVPALEHFMDWDKGDKLLGTVFCLLVVLLLDGLAFFGVVFSLLGVAQARRRKSPRAAHVAAVVLGLAAAAGHLLVSAATVPVLIGVWH